MTLVLDIPNSYECTCVSAYLSSTVGRTRCDAHNCDQSSCAVIKNNYDVLTRTFKSPVPVIRADGSDALRQREPNVYRTPFQVPQHDQDKVRQATLSSEQASSGEADDQDQQQASSGEADDQDQQQASSGEADDQDQQQGPSNDDESNDQRLSDTSTDRNGMRSSLSLILCGTREMQCIELECHLCSAMFKISLSFPL